MRGMQKDPRVLPIVKVPISRTNSGMYFDKIIFLEKNLVRYGLTGGVVWWVGELGRKLDP